MKDSIRQKLEQLSQRFEEITALLAEPETQNDQDRFRALSKEYAQLNPLVTTFRDYHAATDARSFAESLNSDPDPEVRAMAAEEIARFEGSTPELLETLMLEWWRRYGATKASGISKLVMSEASNFPDLARFFQEEVVTPGHAMIRSVLQRGMDRCEFRRVDMVLTIHSVLAPLLFLVTWKHSMAPCCPSTQQIDPETFIRHHAELLVRGLSV